MGGADRSHSYKFFPIANIRVPRLRVYIAAHALDSGETETANARRFPNSAHPLD
jgi:hypothetical protein